MCIDRSTWALNILVLLAHSLGNMPPSNKIMLTLKVHVVVRAEKFVFDVAGRVPRDLRWGEARCRLMSKSAYLRHFDRRVLSRACEVSYGYRRGGVVIRGRSNSKLARLGEQTTLLLFAWID